MVYYRGIISNQERLLLALLQRHGQIIDLGKQFFLSVMEQQTLAMGIILLAAVAADKTGTVMTDG